jgi:hypothetical protein
MITDPSGATVLSSIGRVDGDTLWQFDVRRGSSGANANPPMRRPEPSSAAGSRRGGCSDN